MVEEEKLQEIKRNLIPNQVLLLSNHNTTLVTTNCTHLATITAHSISRFDLAYITAPTPEPREKMNHLSGIAAHSTVKDSNCGT